MYKGLIDHLAFMYGFICKGRGKISTDDMQRMVSGTHAIVENAPAVLGSEDEKAADKADLAEARKMDEDIEEMVIFLMSLEIA